MLDTDEDWRRLTPAGIALELAALALGVTLLWRLPLSGAVQVLAWPRLLLIALPLTALLFAAERRLSRARRAAEWVRYPSALPVLVTLLGVSASAVALVNRLPSRARALRFEEYVVREGDHVIANTPGVVWVSATPDLFVEVPAWRGGGVKQFPVTAEALRPGAERPPALEVEEREGFLRVPYVAGVRLVPR